MTTMLNSQHDQKVLDTALSKAKGRLFFHKGAGFLGSLLCNHKFKWDTEAPTAWCNGETIGLNPDFFMSLDVEGRVTLLAHELWHTGMDHMHRCGDRCPEVFNIAADHVINLMLKSAGYDFSALYKIDFPPCMDNRFTGMTTEEVYDLLIQEGGGNAPSGEVPALSGDIKESDSVSVADVLGKIVQAKQVSQISQEAGVIPGEVELKISEFLDPVLPWEVLLYRYFNEMSQDDYSWRRPSRRYDEEYLPSLMGENGLEHLIYYLDISGSVSDAEIKRFNSEVRYIHQQLRPKRLTLVTFDTALQDRYEFEQDDAFEEITVTGRGGTSLQEVHDDIKELQPTAAVIFSDMYVHPMENPGVPVLWVVLNNPGYEPDFGTAIHIPADKI